MLLAISFDFVVLSASFQYPLGSEDEALALVDAPSVEKATSTFMHPIVHELYFPFLPICPRAYQRYFSPFWFFRMPVFAAEISTPFWVASIDARGFPSPQYSRKLSNASPERLLREMLVNTMLEGELPDSRFSAVK